MSEFHKFLKNDSSSESEEGLLSDGNDDIQPKQEIFGSNEQKFESQNLKTSKTLQICDKIDTKRSNRFSIWSDLLLEEELNHSVNNSLDIKKRQTKRKIDRNCENYSFWTKRQSETKSEKELTINSNNNPINKRKKKKKKRNNNKREPKIQTIDIVVKAAKKLNEPKIDLLRKVYQTIGEEKASELLGATLDIESAGGLMTIDGKRRRTPGGVFFQLLKNDSNIPKQSIESIFNTENKYLKQKKFNKKQKKVAKKSSFAKKTNCDINEKQNIETETMS